MHHLPWSVLLTCHPLGSNADVPKDLVKEIKYIEELFTVDTAKLKQITDHFVKELEKGESSREKAYE